MNLKKGLNNVLFSVCVYAEKKTRFFLKKSNDIDVFDNDCCKL